MPTAIFDMVVEHRLINQMEKFDYLIIGGGIAGTAAAETIRQNDAEGNIAIVSDEPHRLYARINLSKANFFLGRLPPDLIWLKKESWYGETGVRFLGGRRAVFVDHSKKELLLEDGEKIGYGKLLLAIGAEPNKLETAGSTKAGVFHLRTLDDARLIIAASKSAKQAVIVGGGFIGFEMCEMLELAGVEVTLVIRESYYWEFLLDKSSGQMIETALEGGEIRILKNGGVKEIGGEGGVEEVVLESGEKFPCQMVVVGVGIHTPAEWLKSSGIETAKGVVANEYLETSAPDVWAAGDAAEFSDTFIGERVQLGNWANAQTQGRVAGRNMTGRKIPFRLVSSYTTRGFGLSIAFVGDVRPLNDRQIIPRGSPEIGSYARLLLKNGELVGATLINRTQELGIISRLIEKDVDLAGREKELGSPETDLRKFLR